LDNGGWDIMGNIHGIVQKLALAQHMKLVNPVFLLRHAVQKCFEACCKFLEHPQNRGEQQGLVSHFPISICFYALNREILHTFPKLLEGEA